MDRLDFTHMGGAEQMQDPGAPLAENLKGRFDPVYDGGTSEHVIDIAPCSKNVNAMLAEDGIFVPRVSADGWFGHGFYPVAPDVPCGAAGRRASATGCRAAGPSVARTVKPHARYPI